MNFADIENTWRSPHNRPDPATLDQMKNAFIAEHDRRRRGQKLFLFWLGTVLTFLTLRFAVQLFRPDPLKPGIDLAREWGAVLLLLLPWGALVVLARRLSRHDREHGHPAPTLAASVRALLDEVRASRARLRIVAWLHGATLLVLPLVAYQLRAVGKAGDEILVPVFVLWPLIAAGILFGLWRYNRRTLQPREHELEALLKSYE